jgi:PadR family transcriptional regulator PadR
LQCNILGYENRYFIFTPMNDNLTLNLENSKSQMRKGTLEFCILLIIGKKGKVYASDILEELKKIDLIVVEGTLYPLLNRLKSEGILGYSWEESDSGHPRKYYSITTKGKQFIQHLIAGWKALQTSINFLIKNYE